MSPQAGFSLGDQIVPRLIAAIPNAVPYIAPEDAQEVIEHGTALAAGIIHSAERNGKQPVKDANRRRRKPTMACGNVAFYVIVKLRSGRRSTGSSTSDVYGTGTQLNGSSRMASLDEVACVDEANGGDIYEFHDVLADDQEDPATKAARKLDWDAFVSGLSRQEKLIINCLVEGKPASGPARKRGLCGTTLNNRRQHLAQAIIEFVGAEIPNDIQPRPGRRDALHAAHERPACRQEHRSP